MSAVERFLVAGCRSWNRRHFEEMLAEEPGQWHFIERPEELTPEFLAELNPRYVFFMHWSWKVRREIVDDYECVCFHMTDLPYGRGGSPLQNLVVRGHRRTKLTALRMVEEFDAGPIYLKEDLCLEGAAEEVFIRASRLSARMIRTIVEARPEPVEQVGDATVFRRRKPAESRMPALDSLLELYDFIRMLDAEGYPPAFIEEGGFRYEFSRATLRDGRIVADVTIRALDEGDE